MQILSNTNWDFMAKRKLAVFISIVMILVSVTAIAVKGFNLGLDFTGGHLVEVGFKKDIVVEDIRIALAKKGYDDAIVQFFGSSKDIMIRLAPQKDKKGAKISDNILEVLKDDIDSDVELRRVEFVGPQVGDALKEQGGLAIIYALGFILMYVTFRFEKRFSVGAIVALVHDVVIVAGFFSLFQIEFDLTVLAAILAVIGYSLNDTIVVFDRIRENFRVIRKGTIEHIMNVSINQTLTRTIITSLTTMLVLIALYFLGGAIIHGFALALIIGVGVGTYSSIFVASTSLLAMGLTREALMPVVKEGENLDDPNDGNFGAQV